MARQVDALLRVEVALVVARGGGVRASRLDRLTALEDGLEMTSQLRAEVLRGIYGAATKRDLDGSQMADYGNRLHAVGELKALEDELQMTAQLRADALRERYDVQNAFQLNAAKLADYRAWLSEQKAEMAAYYEHLAKEQAEKEQAESDYAEARAAIDAADA